MKHLRAIRHSIILAAIVGILLAPIQVPGANSANGIQQGQGHHFVCTDYSQGKVFIVSPDKQMVWTFFDHKTMKTISSLQLLDVPGDVLKGEIWHSSDRDLNPRRLVRMR